VAAAPVSVVAAVVVAADRAVVTASFLRRSVLAPVPSSSLRQAERRGAARSGLPRVSFQPRSVFLRQTSGSGFSLRHQNSKYEEHICSE
jgi:hypothetical protein